MDEQRQKHTEAADGHSRIDSHIRKTRMAMSLDNLNTLPVKQDAISRPHMSEFGFSNYQGRIAGRYLYLVTKLLCLYTVKGVGWLFRQAKR